MTQVQQRGHDVLLPDQAVSQTPAGGTPQAFGQLLADEMKRWTEVAKAAGIKSVP